MKSISNYTNFVPNMNNRISNYTNFVPNMNNRIEAQQILNNNDVLYSIVSNRITGYDSIGAK